MIFSSCALCSMPVRRRWAMVRSSVEGQPWPRSARTRRGSPARSGAAKGRSNSLFVQHRDQPYERADHARQRSQHLSANSQRSVRSFRIAVRNSACALMVRCRCAVDALPPTPSPCGWEREHRRACFSRSRVNSAFRRSSIMNRTLASSPSSGGFFPSSPPRLSLRARAVRSFPTCQIWRARGAF